MLFGKAIINVRTFNLFNFIYLFIHSFIHSFIYPSIHPSIHLLTYLLISTEIAPLLIDSTFARAAVHCPETPSLGHLSLTATSRDAVITTANTTNEHTSSASFSVSLQLGDLLTSKWQHLERSPLGSVESRVSRRHLMPPLLNCVQSRMTYVFSKSQSTNVFRCPTPEKSILYERKCKFLHQELMLYNSWPTFSPYLYSRV